MSYHFACNFVYLLITKPTSSSKWLVPMTLGVASFGSALGSDPRAHTRPRVCFERRTGKRPSGGASLALESELPQPPPAVAGADS